MGTFHIIRTADNYYVETVRGERADADARAAAYASLCGGPEPAHVLPAEPDYPATVSARAMYGDRYADYIQGSTAARVAAGGHDRRADSLGALLAGNDGD